MEAKIISIHINPKAREEEAVGRMTGRARAVAFRSAEEAWDGVLWQIDMDVAKAICKAMEALADVGDYAGAMSVLVGLYEFGGKEMPEDVCAFKKTPELMGLFMEEFLVESGEYLDEWGENDDLDLND